MLAPCLNAGIALLNLFNLQVALDTLRSLPEESKEYRKAWEELGVSFLWTLSAISATAESAAKYALTQGSSKNLLQLRLNEMLNNSKGTSEKRLIKILRKALALGLFTGITASAFDAYRSLTRAFDKSNSFTMRALLLSQGAAFISQSAGYGMMIYRLIFLQAPIASVGAGLAASLIFWSSLIILTVYLLIYLIKKTPIEEWINKSHWGLQTANWSLEEEVKNYNSIALAPQVIIKDIVHKAYTEDMSFRGEVPIKPEYYLVQVILPSPNLSLSILDKNRPSIKTSHPEIINSNNEVIIQFRIYSKLEKVKFQLGMESSQNWFFTITLNSNKKTSVLISDSPTIDNEDIIYLPRGVV